MWKDRIDKLIDRSCSSKQIAVNWNKNWTEQKNNINVITWWLRKIPLKKGWDMKMYIKLMVILIAWVEQIVAYDTHDCLYILFFVYQMIRIDIATSFGIFFLKIDIKHVGFF